MYNLQDDKCILYSEVLRRCSNLSVSVPLQSTVPLTAFFLSGSGVGSVGNGNSGYPLNSGILRPMTTHTHVKIVQNYDLNAPFNSFKKCSLKSVLNFNQNMAQTPFFNRSTMANLAKLFLRIWYRWICLFINSLLICWLWKSVGK